MSCFAGSWAEGLGEEGDSRRIVVQFSPGAMLDRLDNACGLSTQREEGIATGKRGEDVESEGGHRFLTLHHHHPLPISTLPPLLPPVPSAIFWCRLPAQYRVRWALR